MTIFKTYTADEVRDFDALIGRNYDELLVSARELVRHMMETYQESQNEADCDLLIEASRQETRIVEDVCAYELRKAEQPERLRKAFDDAMRAAGEKCEADRRAEDMRVLALAINRIDETVTLLRQQGQRKRQGFAPSAKATLIRATEAAGGRCPCCGERQVVKDGERCLGAEFDHFFANHIARADAGWLICQGCHRDLTHNASLRTEKAVAFAAFQQHRRSIEAQPQINIGTCERE